MASQAQTAARHLLSGLAALFARAGELLNPERLTGPVLGKELRVSSRRRRNYVLRFLYLGALTISVAIIVPKAGRPGADAGARIVDSILWFQFVAFQFLAVLLLSPAISSEIRSRTLGILMTTPISAFQIVTGKLLGKLLQIIILLAVSLPLLAMVRVFGGVTWGYVPAGLCITLTATIFAGSFTLYYSVRSQSATGVTLLALGVYGAIFHPIAYIISAKGLPGDLSISPAYTMLVNSSMMLNATRGPLSNPWGLHCLLMLLLSLGLLALAARKARGAAQRALSQPAAPGPRRASNVRPRAVRGPALLWKEMRFYLPSSRTKLVLVLLATLVSLGASYASFISNDILREAPMHLFYVFLYLGVGAFVTAVMAATSITVEKESRALPLLLTAPISDAYVVWTKANGVLRRASPPLLFLLAHLVIFTAVGAIHPLTALLLLMLAVYTIAFLLGLGLYFSSRFQTSSAATAMTFVSVAVVWILLPLVLGNLPREDLPFGSHLFQVADPLVQVVVVIRASAEYYNSVAGAISFEGPYGPLSPWQAADVMLLSLVAYSGMGFLLAWRAKARLRKNLFAQT